MRRQRWAPRYVRGLLGPGDRKSVEPMAERVAPGDYQQLHHFVCTSRWRAEPLEQVLAEKAQALLGGPGAVLIVDDTQLVKQGRHSVGVARQHVGATGGVGNCQALVSVTLARDEVPMCLALRLYLPAEWTGDPARLDEAGVPEADRAHRAKWEIAVAELDRVVAAGVTCGCVCADAGYGAITDFRRALSARGLRWAVGVHRTTHVYPAEASTYVPLRRVGGRPRTCARPTLPSARADVVLARAAWAPVTWRDGTKGPLAGRFAAVRVRVADGAYSAATSPRLPGELAWLVGEERGGSGRAYYVTNHPADAPLADLVAAVRARWSCEQAHQQLKEELGLDHFEGRSWRGLHHHALLAMISLAFLQHLRLAEAARARGRGEKVGAASGAAAGADAPCGAPGAPRPRPPRRRAPLPRVPRARRLPADRPAVDLAK